MSFLSDPSWSFLFFKTPKRSCFDLCRAVQIGHASQIKFAWLPETFMMSDEQMMVIMFVSCATLELSQTSPVSHLKYTARKPNSRYPRTRVRFWSKDKSPSTQTKKTNGTNPKKTNAKKPRNHTSVPSPHRAITESHITHIHSLPSEHASFNARVSPHPRWNRKTHSATISRSISCHVSDDVALRRTSRVGRSLSRTVRLVHCGACGKSVVHRSSELAITQAAGICLRCRCVSCSLQCISRTVIMSFFVSWFVRLHVRRLLL